MTEVTSLSYSEERMRDFWYWIVERQSIYHKRVVLKQQPPWTNDPILSAYFFTNCYREEDKGTKFWTEDILPHCWNYQDVLWNLFVYRYFNSIPTYRFLVDRVFCTDLGLNKVLRYRDGWDHIKIAQALTRWSLDGNKPFTSAFTVTGVRFGGYPDKIRNVCWLMEQLYKIVPNTIRRLACAENLRDVFDTFHSLDGMGAFLAYELTIDINYTHTLVNFSEDDFVNPGPGCMAGLRYIYGNHPKSVYEQILRELRIRQKAYFKVYGLWDTWKQVYPGYDLSLRSIEHSLCEYSKYARTKYQITSKGDASRNATRRFDITSRMQGQLV